MELARVEFGRTRGPHLSDIYVVLQVQFKVVREVRLIFDVVKMLGPLRRSLFPFR